MSRQKRISSFASTTPKKNLKIENGNLMRNMKIFNSNPIPSFIDVEEISRKLINAPNWARNNHFIVILSHHIKQDKFH